jgi:hypothetical protein
MKRKTSQVVLGLLLLAAVGRADRTVINDFFRLTFNDAGIAGLKRSHDPAGIEYLSAGKTFGHVFVRYRMWTGPVQEFATERLADRRMIKQGSEDGTPQLILTYNGSGWYDYFADLEFTERFRLEEDSLFWTLHFRNVTHKPVEISDLFIPLPFDVRASGKTAESAGGKGKLVLRSVIRGERSYLYLAPADGPGPCLVMLPVEKCPLFEPAQTERNFAPVRLTAQDEIGVYILSSMAGAVETTKWTLSPKFTPGDEITWGFKFRWAANEKNVREILSQEGIVLD